FGAFRLEDLLPGEEFFGSDGTPGKVCDQQQFGPEYVQVLWSIGTANAMKKLLHRTACGFGTSPEEARRIARRVKGRGRRRRAEAPRAATTNDSDAESQTDPSPES